jgi:hypothetical protein
MYIRAGEILCNRVELANIRKQREKKIGWGDEKDKGSLEIPVRLENSS